MPSRRVLVVIAVLGLVVATVPARAADRVPTVAQVLVASALDFRGDPKATPYAVMAAQWFASRQREGSNLEKMPAPPAGDMWRVMEYYLTASQYGPHVSTVSADADLYRIWDAAFFYRPSDF